MPTICQIRNLFFLFLCLWTIPLQATGLVDKVQQTYQGINNLQADFIQTTQIKLLDREITETGDLTIARPECFLIHYQGAKERSYISNGKTLWIYRPQDREVEVYENAKELISSEALVFLGGLGSMTKEYKVVEGGKGKLTLIPKKKGSLFARLVLIVDAETTLVKEVSLVPRAKNGNMSHYVFSSTRVNEKIPNPTFEFQGEFHGDVKVVRSTEP